MGILTYWRTTWLDIRGFDPGSNVLCRLGVDEANIILTGILPLDRAQ